MGRLDTKGREANVIHPFSDLLGTQYAVLRIDMEPQQRRRSKVIMPPVALVAPFFDIKVFGACCMTRGFVWDICKCFVLLISKVVFQSGNFCLVYLVLVAHKVNLTQGKLSLKSHCPSLDTALAAERAQA